MMNVSHEMDADLQVFLLVVKISLRGAKVRRPHQDDNAVIGQEMEGDGMARGVICALTNVLIIEFVRQANPLWLMFHRFTVHNSRFKLFHNAPVNCVALICPTRHKIMSVPGLSYCLKTGRYIYNLKRGGGSLSH